MNKVVILFALISLTVGSPIAKSKHAENTPENRKTLQHLIQLN